MGYRTVKLSVCNRCAHEWLARGQRKPVMCPRCKSTYWDDDKPKRKSTRG